VGVQGIDKAQTSKKFLMGMVIPQQAVETPNQLGDEHQAGRLLAD
jgi:hypothetical protein